MPPVFGPRSPSKIGLWSWQRPNGIASSPSQSAKNESSSPCRTPRGRRARPRRRTCAPPSRRRSRHARSRRSWQRRRPCRARGRRLSPRLAPARSARTRAPLRGSSKTSKSAVGTPASRITDFAKDLLLSSCAAAFEGPKTRSPARSNSSTIPAASGSSGPTIVRSILFSFANATSPAKSSGAIGDRLGELIDSGIAAAHKRVPIPIWL